MTLAQLTAAGVLTPPQQEMMESLSRQPANEEGVPKPPNLSREKLWQLAPASVEIFTELLDGVDKSPGETTVPERWLARILKFLWMFVEATVPRRPLFAAFRYWFQILFTITAVVLILTFFGVWESALPTAAKFMGGLVGVYVVTEVVRGFVARRFDVILTSLGTGTAVTGGFLLLYQMLVNGVNVRDTALVSTRFTLTLVALLCIPALYSILYWLGRKLFGGSQAKSLEPLASSPGFGELAWRLSKLWGARLLVLFYIIAVAAVGTFLLLNPSEPRLMRKTVPLTVEQTVPLRAPSGFESYIQNRVDRLWGVEQ